LQQDYFEELDISY